MKLSGKQNKKKPVAEPDKNPHGKNINHPYCEDIDQVVE